MFRKIGDALRRFMAGRYGTDKLNQWLLGLAIVLIVLGLTIVIHSFKSYAKSEKNSEKASA